MLWACLGFAGESFCPGHEIVHSSNQVVSCGNGHAFHTLASPSANCGWGGALSRLGMDLLQLWASWGGDWLSPGVHTLVPMPHTQKAICPEHQT